MARKHRHEEHENHERWLVSYADFITLLFAFFVVMYAISSVNEGKYRVLSESLEVAFSDSPLRTIEPIQVGELARVPEVNLADARATRDLPREEPLMRLEGPGLEPIPIQKMAEGQPEPKKDLDSINQREERPDIHSIADELTEALGPLIDEELIEVRQKSRWVEVEMKSHILFESGSARLSPKATPLLTQLASVLSRFGNPIRVEGFTDNQPISTAVYPSNWELSAARAASVVHLFSTLSITPERMAAIGHGEQRAIADNSTPEGRQKNRRVVIVVSAEEEQPHRIYEAGPIEEGETPLQEGPLATGGIREAAVQTAAPRDDIGTDNAKK